MLSLDDEILRSVIGHLDHEGWFNLLSACRRFYRLCTERTTRLEVFRPYVDYRPIVFNWARLEDIYICPTTRSGDTAIIMGYANDIPYMMFAYLYTDRRCGYWSDMVLPDCTNLGIFERCYEFDMWSEDEGESEGPWEIWEQEGPDFFRVSLPGELSILPVPTFKMWIDVNMMEDWDEEPESGHVILPLFSGVRHIKNKEDFCNLYKDAAAK